MLLLWSFKSVAHIALEESKIAIGCKKKWTRPFSVCITYHVHFSQDKPMCAVYVKAVDQCNKPSIVHLIFWSASGMDYAITYYIYYIIRDIKQNSQLPTQINRTKIRAVSCIPESLDQISWSHGPSTTVSHSWTFKTFGGCLLLTKLVDD